MDDVATTTRPPCVPHKTPKGISVAIREAIPSDTKLIRGAFLHSYQRNSDFAEYVSNDIYTPFFSAIVDQIMKSSQILVVTPPGDDEGSVQTILGFMIRERNAPVVHYVYVQTPNRRWGIARMLLAPLGERYHFTHLTKLAAQILSGEYASWCRSRDARRMEVIRGTDGPRYHPFLIPALIGAIDWRPKK